MPFLGTCSANPTVATSKAPGSQASTHNAIIVSDWAGQMQSTLELI